MSEKTKLLRYGELAAKHARGDATSEDIKEMEGIRKELSLSETEILDKVEEIVKLGY